MWQCCAGAAPRKRQVSDSFFQLLQHLGVAAHSQYIGATLAEYWPNDKKIQLQSTGSRAGEGGSEQLGATVSASAKKQSFTFSKGYDIRLANLKKCGP